jgi:hypothetical protein
MADADDTFKDLTTDAMARLVREKLRTLGVRQARLVAHMGDEKLAAYVAETNAGALAAVATQDPRAEGVEAAVWALRSTAGRRRA